MSVTNRETIIIGRRRSERLLTRSSRDEGLSGKNDEENNGPLEGRVDPSQVLPLEVFVYLLEKCFGELPLNELQEMRFVSRDWRTGLERMWRKRVVVCLNYSFISEFLMQIMNPSFDYENTPLRNFKIKRADFSSSDVRDFLEYCGPYIKQLNWENPTIMGPASSFYQYLFVTLNNMEQLQLVNPHLYDKSYIDRLYDIDDLSEPDNLPVARNLFSLVLDLRLLSADNHHGFPFHMTQKFFWSSFPNLKKLAVLSHSSNRIFKTEIFLQSVKELSLVGNHFQHLKHLQICHNSLWDSHERNVGILVKVEKICNSQFPSLESFHFHFYAQGESDEEQLPLVAQRIVNAFGRQLKSLTLLLEPLQVSEIFPFRTRLEKMEHLTVSCDLSDFILNAKYLPNLKSFSARTGYCTRATCIREMRQRVYWLNPENRVCSEAENHRCSYSNNNIKDFEKFWTQYQQETMDDPLDNDFIFFEDDDGILQKCETPANEDKIILKRGQPEVHNYNPVSEKEKPEFQHEWQATTGFLSRGYRRLRRSIVFENVTEFAVEMPLSCTIFKKLPKWMPSVISLEAQITACTFPVICDKWRKMQKLTVLNQRKVCPTQTQDLAHNRDFANCENYAPIDDCAIIGVKHFANPRFKCSLQHLLEGERKSPEINWEHFLDPLKPSLIPNLTFLKDLTHFKMAIGRITNVDTERMTLSDESVLHGFLKLPKLEYLELLADINTVTIQHLFKKIRKCIVYRLRDDEPSSLQENPHDDSHVEYYGRRNF